MTEGAQVPRREPDEVMRLRRLGSLHQCRLSFMRILTRRMAADGWTFGRPVFDIDANGTGHAVYSADTGERIYSLIAFAHDLPPEQRSDRVIAEAWDATFALFDGVPGAEDIARLSRNVPVQEAGRLSERELTLSRANRSVRLWDNVVSSLAAGRQPDPAMVEEVGYLMRTTAVYGSGKFGASDRDAIAGRPEMHPPFQAEMLTVYMIRQFVRDLVEHMAVSKGGDRAARLRPETARLLGIGNSTGLGMAPFIVNHPRLFNNWLMAREEAIARVRSETEASPTKVEAFVQILARAAVSVDRWRTGHDIQREKLTRLRSDIAKLRTHIAGENLSSNRPWDRLVRWAARTLGDEAQEMLNALLLEPYPELVDGLAECMADDAPSTPRIDGAMRVGAVRELIRENFGWALDVDWSNPSACARAWYVSEEKLEPRLGQRFEEPIEEFEQPLAPARDAAMAYADLCAWADDRPIADFLLALPRHRAIVRRAQMAFSMPYGEIRDNTIDAALMPIDMLRAKLSFFGATHFDPRSDRWVRVSMYVGAPYPEELTIENADLWVYPELDG